MGTAKGFTFPGVPSPATGSPRAGAIGIAVEVAKPLEQLHWHATAAEWAFVIEGRVRTTVIDPQGNAETNDFEPGRRLVLPPRPRPHARVPGRRAVPLHPDLRQRLLLRVRHVQHHRLDRPHPEGAAGEELRPARVGLRRLPQGRGLLRPRAGAARRSPPTPLQGLEAAAADAQVPDCSPRTPHSIYKGGREWRVDSDRFPISKTITGVILDLEPGGLARAALAPDRRRVAVRHRGQGQRDDVRLARPLPDRDAREGRRRLHPAGLRPLDRERRRQAVPRPDRLQHRRSTRRSTCRSGSPATRPSVLATNFGKPESLFEKFPQRAGLHRPDRAPQPAGTRGALKGGPRIPGGPLPSPLCHEPEAQAKGIDIIDYQFPHRSRSLMGCLAPELFRSALAASATRPLAHLSASPSTAAIFADGGRSGIACRSMSHLETGRASFRACSGTSLMAPARLSPKPYF